MAKDKLNIWIILGCYLLLLFVIIGLASCNTQKMALKKQQWIERNDPNTLLKYCASIAKSDTVIIKGKDSIMDDNYITLPRSTVEGLLANLGTKESNSDTIIKYEKGGVEYVKIKCPPVHIQTPDTIKIKTVDTSGLGVLSEQNKQLIQDKKKIQGNVETMTVWAIIGWIIAIAFAVICGFLIRK